MTANGFPSIAAILAARPKVKVWPGFGEANGPIQFVEVKYDGYRASFIKDLDGACTMQGRKTDFWPRLADSSLGLELQRCTPPGTVLEGELYLQGGNATDTVTAVNEGDPALRFSVFATPWVNGFPTTKRTLLPGDQVRFADRWRWGDFETLVGASDLESGMARLAGELGVEGFVLKSEEYAGWYKFKPTKTVDVVVMGQTASESITFWGDLKAIQVGVYDAENRALRRIASVGSGFTAEQRADLADTDLVGRVAEIRYDSLAAKGQLKFPRFLRWRDDKDARECTIDQLSL